MEQEKSTWQSCRCIMNKRQYKKKIKKWCIKYGFSYPPFELKNTVFLEILNKQILGKRSEI